MSDTTQESKRKTIFANVDHKHRWNRTYKTRHRVRECDHWTGVNVKKMVHHRRIELRMNARYAGVKLGNPEQSNRIEIEKT